MFGSVSLEDAIGAPFYTLGTAVASGIATVQVFSTNLASNAINLGTGGISFAFLLGIIPLLMAFYTSNVDAGDVLTRPEDSGLENEEWGAFAGGTVTVVGLEFVPQIQTAVQSNEVLSVIALGLASGAYYLVAYRYGDR